MKGSFFLIGIILCLYSCDLEETGYYSDSFGLVKLSGSMQYIESDEGETLIPSQNVSAFVETGDRVWISYTVEQENAKRDTLTILPYRVTRIMPLKLENETELSEDGIDLWTVWLAQGFLTFDFRIRAKDQEKMKDHKYALVSPRKEITDTLFINFRHDAGEDNYGVLCRTAVTLKLDDLKIARDSLVIAVDYRNLNGVRQTEYRTYRKVRN